MVSFMYMHFVQLYNLLIVYVKEPIMKKVRHNRSNLSIKKFSVKSVITKSLVFRFRQSANFFPMYSVGFSLNSSSVLLGTQET